MKTLLAWLFGTVTARITGAQPEDFLNLCARENLVLWRMVQRDLFTLEVQVTARQYARLCQLAQGAQCGVELEKRQGLPYFFLRFRRRYALLAGVRPPDGVDEKKFYFIIALLDQAYWIAGSLAGAVAGSLITINTEGIDFAMTALFVTIFVDQWREAKSHLPAVIGLISSVICLLIFGGSNFILPSLIITVTILMALQKRLEGKVENT